MTKYIETEKQKRETLLKDCGFDTEGFGLLNIFFLYDYVTGYFSWIANKLHSLGMNKLAYWISGVSITQIKRKGLEIHQAIFINGSSGSYKQESYIHDEDPEKARAYVLDKYKLSNMKGNS